MVLASVFLSVVIGLCGGYYIGPKELAKFSERALAGSKESEHAIRLLRNWGPRGLAALLKHPQAVNHPEVVDRVAGQRDAFYSKLYWYDDYRKARIAAIEQDKPILSLRLLGKLTDEYSCANSRFFRTILYPNEQVSNFLRQHYVLHWKTVREVPRITIDFGDGRKIENTITGNSIHYILSPEGDLIDAIPGLYTPGYFLRHLSEGFRVNSRIKNVTGEAREKVLTKHIEDQKARIARNWETQLLGFKAAPPVPVKSKGGQIKIGSPDAALASFQAVSKSAMELPLLEHYFSDAYLQSLEESTDRDLWEKIAAGFVNRLDHSSKELIRTKFPTAWESTGTAEVKRMMEGPFLNMISKLEKNTALDTVKNEFLRRPKILTMLLAGGVKQDLEALNDQVYEQVFLTPKTDPWLGLKHEAIFTALDGGGITRSK